MPTPHKTCTKCRETKPLDGYHKKRATRDGRQTQCKECIRAYEQANRERISEYGRAYREANREKISEYRRAHYAANSESIKEASRTYYEENRDFLSRDLAQRAKQMNDLTRLTATRNGQPWEQWEDDFIAAHPEMTTYQIANHLGRTYTGAQQRKFKLRRKGVLAQ